MLSLSTWFFLMFWQVLTGDQPFHHIKSTELVYHVSNGLRPEKPENAEAIGISDPLWGFIRKCWDDERTRRPQIQEVVAGVGSAAANWHTDMPPGGAEHQEEPVSEEPSNDLKHNESLFLISYCAISLTPFVQLGYSRVIRATMRWNPMKSIPTPFSNTWTRITSHPHQKVP